jgi:bifunctional non-homologous end joining protein LigD
MLATAKKSGANKTPMPLEVAPMLAAPGEIPPDPENYVAEIKWDGVRAIAFCDGKTVRLQSRNLLDITSKYPELQALGKAIGKTTAILDGEIVSLDENGRPSFARLQRRMHIASRATAIRLSESEPVWFVIFDLLYIRGKWIGDLPYRARRKLLEEVTIAGPYWQITPSHEGELSQMLAAARDNHLEGVVAKRLDSTYQPGRRSPDWLKIKIIQSEEFVIGGWIPEKGDISTQRVGALLMGYFNCRGKLRYAGAVGSGFDAVKRQNLSKGLMKHARATSPFAEAPPRANVRFLEPALVAQIEYRRWPAGGLLQHAVYQGLRTDKRASEIIRDGPNGSEASTNDG